MNGSAFFGQLVIGPAGSGKSTYCKVMQEMAETLRRNIVIFNLDPAAEYNEYRCDVDIQELVTLQDVMQEMELGPNGGLLFCMEYLIQNQSWLQQKLNEFVGSDDYVIFDCPGQIELYNDQDVFRQLVKILQNYGFSLISMYMIDINFISDQNKFVSVALQALSTQIALELPSITVLTKCDLAPNKQEIDAFVNRLSVDYEQTQYIQNMINEHSKTQNSSQKLYEAIRKVINSNDIISIRQLNLDEQDSIRDLLLEADNAIQYGQNLEPNQKVYEQAQKSMNQQ